MLTDSDWMSPSVRYGNALARIIAADDPRTGIADEVQRMADDLADSEGALAEAQSNLDGIRDQCIEALRGIVGAETHRGTPNLVWQLCQAIAEMTEVPVGPATDELMVGWASDLDAE